jgi:hypothetical protein
MSSGAATRKNAGKTSYGAVSSTEEMGSVDGKNTSATKEPSATMNSGKVTKAAEGGGKKKPKKTLKSFEDLRALAKSKGYM